MVTDDVSDNADAEGPKKRCGFVAVIGATNAGKSTLVNALVGTKVSIVSHKVQTTRAPLRGIAMVGSSQIVFIDTPGIFEPKRRFDKAMVDSAWGGAGDADLSLLVVDAVKGVSGDVKQILGKLGERKAHYFLVLNKVDRVSDKGALLALASKLGEFVEFERVFMVSSTSGDGLDELKRFLAGHVPLGPWHYPEDDVSDAPMRSVAAEITREKIFERLHQELPYAITVETTSWETLRNKSIKVEQTIFVERDSQKSIVLGKSGSMIKLISSLARAEIGKIVERPVHLFLFVKVREGWQSDPERYREMGLDFPKGS